MSPRGPPSSQALGQGGCSTSSKKPPQRLCRAITSVIYGHGVGARNVRCIILHVSWAPFQLASDFGAVFLKLSLFSVPILSHFCESLHDSLSPALDVLWNCRWVRWVQGDLCTHSARCCSCRPCWKHQFSGASTARTSHSYQPQPLRYSSLQCFLELKWMYWNQIKVPIAERANYFLK